MTVMLVINAAGQNYTSDILYHWKQVHFCIVNVILQTHSDVQLRCYYHTIEDDGVDTLVFFTWAKQVIKDIFRHLVGGQRILLLRFSYVAMYLTYR